MRFFKLACIFGIFVAVFGCASEKWAWNKKKRTSDSTANVNDNSEDARYRSWVQFSGSDERSRSVEKSLGIR